jgi:hypothetical protein
VTCPIKSGIAESANISVAMQWWKNTSPLQSNIRRIAGTVVFSVVRYNGYITLQQSICKNSVFCPVRVDTI